MPAGADARFGSWFNGGAGYAALGDTPYPKHIRIQEGVDPEWDPHFKKEREILCRDLYELAQEREIQPIEFSPQEILEAQERRERAKLQLEEDRLDRVREDRRREKRRVKRLREERERKAQEEQVRQPDPPRHVPYRPPSGFTMRPIKGEIEPVHDGADVWRVTPDGGGKQTLVEVTAYGGTLYMDTFLDGMYLNQRREKVGAAATYYILVDVGSPVRFFTR